MNKETMRIELEAALERIKQKALAIAENIANPTFIVGAKIRLYIDYELHTKSSEITEEVDLNKEDIIRCTYCGRQIRDDEYCRTQGEKILRCCKGPCDKQMPTEEELNKPPRPCKEDFPPTYGKDNCG